MCLQYVVIDYWLSSQYCFWLSMSQGNRQTKLKGTGVGGGEVLPLKPQNMPISNIADAIVKSHSINVLQGNTSELNKKNDVGF